MEAKFTKGPLTFWGVQSHTEIGGFYAIGRADMEGACTAYVAKKADAELYIAAPGLHDDGEKLANEVDGLKAFEHEIRAAIGNTNWNVLRMRLEKMRAALLKAKREGRT